MVSDMGAYAIDIVLSEACGEDVKMKRHIFLLISLVLILLLMGSSVSAAPREVADDEDTYIWGIVCDDLDADLDCDNLDEPLTGVTVTLYDDDMGVEDTYITGYNGHFQFTVEDDDDYFIGQTNLEGYVSLSADLIEFEGDPGERLGPYYFCDTHEGPILVDPMICTLSALVFVDRNGDGIYQAGYDYAVPGAAVTATYADGTIVTRETASLGWVYFLGNNVVNGVTLSVNVPETFRGYTLIGPGSVHLTPDDFNMNHAHTVFEARITATITGP